jgi:high-affinity K+ transport system ATPase subunit B
VVASVLGDEEATAKAGAAEAGVDGIATAPATARNGKNQEATRVPDPRSDPALVAFLEVLPRKD